MIVQNSELRKDEIVFDYKGIGSIIFVAIVLILFAQYGSKKIAFSIAGLVLITSLLMNIEKVKEVFSQ